MNKIDRLERELHDSEDRRNQAESQLHHLSQELTQSEIQRRTLHEDCMVIKILEKPEFFKN